LLAKYPNLNQANTIGNYSGKLSHNGDRVVLAKPSLFTPVGKAMQPATVYVTQDEVTYGTGGRWGQWAAGGGSSLELINPRSNHRLAANWRDSDETQKSVWVNIESSGVLDNGANYERGILHAQIGLLDVGECLVDNIEVVGSDGVTNLVANSDFETDLSNWSLQGCMSRSSLENTGYQSSQSLHVRCSDRLWTGVNSCQMTLSANSLAAGQTATLRFKARWLHGWPEALLRLNGNWLEATGQLPVPANLGTPGARNSQYVANAGPAIYEVAHTPSIPAANQAVVVTARVNDPDGAQGISLSYRVDPATEFTTVAMIDNGTGGDAIAGDGIYSAKIPGYSAGTIVAFSITAQDSQGASSRFPALRDDNAPVREGVILFGDGNPGGGFGVYHLWITQTNVNRWVKLSDLSNESHDGTFVNGTRIIYDAEGRFAGSPYHQDFDTPYGALCHYKWTFPDDDKFLGATSFNKIHQPGNGAGDDLTVQREQLANSFLRALGVPWLNRRYVAVYVNGHRRGTLMEDAQTPDGDLVKEYFPDDNDGYLYKMQPWFECAPAPSGRSIGDNNESWCNLMPYTTTGGQKKTARYRYNFLVRRTPDSANNFRSVFALVDAAASYGSAHYAANMENLADMENWMRVFAANHAAGNWDSYGAQNAQNLYGYIGTLGTRYSLMMWDFNIVFGNSGSWGPGQNLFSGNGQDPNTANIYDEPAFRRMYWRALQELVNGPLDVANSGPLLDSKYRAFVASGVTVQNPSTLKTWLTSARTSISSQVAGASTSNFTVNPSISVVEDTAVLSGQAPVEIKTLLVNGVEYPVTWTSVTGWRVTVPLQPGTNSLAVVGVDMHGQPIPGAAQTVEATYGGPVPDPTGQIAINEIMTRPTLPGAEYIELANNSADWTYDLSGWSLPEVSYTFPPGAFIAPNQYLVLTADRLAYATAYGATTPVFDTFPGILSPDQQTLTLHRPGPGGSNDILVTRVRYESALPWPNMAGEGNSLQLIDPAQDNSRVGNWTVVNGNSPASPQWQYATLTGIATKSTLLIGLLNSGDVYIDDVKLVSGSVPEVGQNYIIDGDFESSLAVNWTVSANVSGSVLSKSVKHSGSASLHLIATSGGPTLGQAVWQNTIPLETNATYTLSYWYLPGSSSVSLLVRLSGSSPGKGHVYSLETIQPPGGNSLSATPGAPNSVRASLAAFPPIWLNEVQPQNVNGLVTGAGQRAPWLELYNPSSNVVSLAGLYLSKDYANLTGWPFPADTVLRPSEFKVIFADGQTALSSTSELHANFSLSPSTGSLALSRLENNGPRVLDYINYSNLPPDSSYGSLPDGQNFSRVEFSTPTPGAPNQPSLNHAPVLSNPGDQSVYPGETVRIVFQASDPDQQAITFSLDPGTPATAVIDPVTGVFTWTTSSDVTPGPHVFTVRASDSGVPPLSATQNITINVLSPLALGVTAVNNGTLQLSWPTVAGRSYRLEYTDDVVAGIWTTFGVDIPGTGAAFSLSAGVSTEARFYRLSVVP
jgi:hypothetical protein